MSRIISLALVGFFVCASFASAQMTSTNYMIRWDAVSTGGSDTGTSASYILRDTSESVVAGTSTSSSYQLEQGYRGGVFDRLIKFSVLVQDLSDERAATALSGTTITTSTTGISVGDFIVLVQDKGEAQVSAMGKVTSVGASTIVVDELKNGGSAPSIDGSNDYLYQLDASSLSMGTLSTSDVSTAILAWEISAEVDNGYVVQILEDGDFRSGSANVADVTDGTVTAGADEYGARSSDTTLSNSSFDSSDTAITGSAQEVASESSAAFKSRNFLTIKAAPSSSNTSGEYAHTISLIASGNF